jgi:hypothetical protein
MKKTSTFNNLGGLQSLFFCLGIYAVSLFFSMFICSAVFSAFNPRNSVASQAVSRTGVPAEKLMFASIGK